MRGQALLVCLLFGLVSCIADARWRTLPETQLPYAEAWDRVVVTVQKAEFGIAIIDEKTGYLETGWKTTKHCEYKGEPATCERARVVVEVVKRAPFRIKLKVDRQKPDLFSYDSGYTDLWGHFRDWRPWGNDWDIEKELIKTINGELRTPPGAFKTGTVLKRGVAPEV